MTAQRWLWAAALALLILGGERGMCGTQSDRDKNLEPWASNTDPTDAPRRQV